MKSDDELNEVNYKKHNNRLWKANKNDTAASALKINFKHTSSSDCNFLCAKQSLTSTNYNNELPYPLSQNSEHCLKDTVHDLVDEKRSFQMAVDDICSVFKRCQKKLNVKRQFKCYEDMQCTLEKDPDAFFCSNYNWYYTGGNLQFQNVGEINLLFHVLNRKLAVARVKRKPSHWKVNKKETISTEFESDVFQLDSFSKNNLLLVSAREKHKINLFEISIEDSIKSNQIDTRVNEIPFVGHSINKNEGSEYTTIDTNHVLNIWDIETKRKKFTYKVPIDKDDLDGDYFAQISYRNDNTITYINRTECYIFDTRANCKSRIYLKNTDLIASIDKFTNICPNKEFDSIFFISSFREILQMDIRYLSAVNKWGYMFNSAPLLSDLKTIEGQNVYCVSSANPTDKILINNSNIPEYLPSCVKSFETSLLANPYLNKQEEILTRLNFHTTGFQLHHNKDGQTVLFSVNSAGDLFSQNIKCETPDDSNSRQKITKKFQKWNNTIVDWCKESDNFEKITVVDKVVLRDLKINNKETKISDDFRKNLLIKNCVLDLKRTKKGVNSKITNVWLGIETDELNDMEEIEPHANVTNWLNQSSLVTPENNII